MERKSDKEELGAVRERFIDQWGALGTAWGINRTMAQIHALLLTTEGALTTDEVMDQLRISRGNANTNLRDLVGWGLIRSTFRKGERKEYFEAEKEVWRIFCTVAKERKRREIEPVLEVLEECEARTRKLKGAEARAFHSAIDSLAEFVGMGGAIMDRVANSRDSRVVKILQQVLK